MNADNSNNNNNNAENSAGAKSQKIEDRVHTLQASLRQGRDRARRDYELATERLGLLQAEVQSAEGAVQERETRHDAIVRETRRLQDEIPPLRATVEKLTKEMNFQHNEILAKREKQKRMEIAMEKSQSKRQKIKDEVQQDVKNRRERRSKMTSPGFPLTPLTRQALRDELQADDSIVHRRFARKFPDLVQEKEDMYTAEIQRMKHQELPALQRIVDRYAEQFGTATDATMEESPHQEESSSNAMAPVGTSVTLDSTQGAVKPGTN